MSNISQKGAAGPGLDLYSTTSAATTYINSDISNNSLTGSRWDTADGREFVLVQVGATAIAAGVVVQSPAAMANSGALSPATTSTTGYSASYPIAAAIGGKQIQIASGATAVLANRFTNGYLTVIAGTGAGQTMAISSNTAASTTSAFVVTLEDAFTTATASDSRYTLTINPYGSIKGTDYSTDGVIISPATTLTGKVIGVTAYPLPASTATVASYGFVQTRGPVACLAGSTVAIGIDAAVPTSTAGMLVTYAVASTTRIGTCLVASSSGQYNLIDVQL